MIRLTVFLCDYLPLLAPVIFITLLLCSVSQVDATLNAMAALNYLKGELMPAAAKTGDEITIKANEPSI